MARRSMAKSSKLSRAALSSASFPEAALVRCSFLWIHQVELAFVLLRVKLYAGRSGRLDVIFNDGAVITVHDALCHSITDTQERGAAGEAAK